MKSKKGQHTTESFKTEPHFPAERFIFVFHESQQHVQTV